MNVFRFLKKCLLDRPAAIKSFKNVFLLYYNQFRFYSGFWTWMRIGSDVIKYKLSTGGILLLESGHNFIAFLYQSKGEYEPEVSNFMMKILNKGDTFIDCGANVGYFSVLAGDLVKEEGQVISIEANPITFSLLKRNIKNNGLNQAINCALTSKKGNVELFFPSTGDVLSSIAKNKYFKGSSIRSFKVEGITLDELVQSIPLKRIDLIKIDIEGGEIDVLKSSKQIFSKFRPIFVVEHCPETWSSFGYTYVDLQEIIDDNGYILREFNVEEQTLVVVTEDVWKRPYTNLIILPKERSSDVYQKLQLY